MGFLRFQLGIALNITIRRNKKIPSISKVLCSRNCLLIKGIS